MVQFAGLPYHNMNCWQVWPDPQLLYHLYSPDGDFGAMYMVVLLAHVAQIYNGAPTIIQ